MSWYSISDPAALADEDPRLQNDLFRRQVVGSDEISDDATCSERSEALIERHIGMVST